MIEQSKKMNSLHCQTLACLYMRCWTSVWSTSKDFQKKVQHLNQEKLGRHKGSVLSRGKKVVIEVKGIHHQAWNFPTKPLAAKNGISEWCAAGCGGPEEDILHEWRRCIQNAPRRRIRRRRRRNPTKCQDLSDGQTAQQQSWQLRKRGLLNFQGSTKIDNAACGWKGGLFSSGKGELYSLWLW